MSLFRYKATEKNGQIKEGVVTAKTKSEAVILLRSAGLSPLVIKKTDHAPFPFWKRKIRISLLEKADFCRYLGTMIAAGLPIGEAIDVILEETTHPGMKKVLAELKYGLQSGESLSSILSKYPQVFDEVFLALVKTGEESGTLEKSLDYLARQLYADYELRQKVKGALYYPMVVVTAMIAVGLLMLTFVIPRVARVFLKMKIPLPLPTRIFLQLSLFLGANWLFFLAGIFFLVILLFLLFQRPTGKKIFHWLYSHLPVISRLINQLDLARFNRTLSTLLRSGVPIIESLRVASASLTQKKYLAFAKTFEKEISRGVSLSTILRKSDSVFPSMMVRLIAAGEKTGKLEELLLDLALFYEAEVTLGLKNMIDLLEPTLMIVIGVAIGAMVLSIIGPIYSLIGSLQVQ